MADSPDWRKRRAEEGGDHPERDGVCVRRRGADVSEEKIRLLVEWLGQKGAKMDAIKIARGEHGISVFAERDICEDEVMACIPRNIALGATQVTLLLVTLMLMLPENTVLLHVIEGHSLKSDSHEFETLSWG
jgi:hypothetical protein